MRQRNYQLVLIALAVFGTVTFRGSAEAQSDQNPTPIVIQLTPDATDTPQPTATPIFAADRFEPNNSAETATVIGAQTEQALTLIDEDVDYFTGQLSAGQTVQVEATGRDGLSVATTLLWQGKAVGERLYTAPDDGWFVLEMRKVSAANGRYDLTITYSEPVQTPSPTATATAAATATATALATATEMATATSVAMVTTPPTQTPTQLPSATAQPQPTQTPFPSSTPTATTVWPTVTPTRIWPTATQPPPTPVTVWPTHTPVPTQTKVWPTATVAPPTALPAAPTATIVWPTHTHTPSPPTPTRVWPTHTPTLQPVWPTATATRSVQPTTVAAAVSAEPPTIATRRPVTQPPVSISPPITAAVAATVTATTTVTATATIDAAQPVALTVRYLGQVDPLMAAATPQPATPIRVQVYYDANNDRAPSPTEGIPNVSVLAVDGRGQQLARVFTNAQGEAVLTLNDPSVARVIVPFVPNWSARVRAGQQNEQLVLGLPAVRLPVFLPVQDTPVDGEE